MRFAVFSILVLGACAQKASVECLDYTVAQDACLAEAIDAGLEPEFGPGGSDPVQECLELQDVFSDDVWECQAVAARTGDCSTQEGLDDITEAQEGCVLLQ